MKKQTSGGTVEEKGRQENWKRERGSVRFSPVQMQEWETLLPTDSKAAIISEPVLSTTLLLCLSHIPPAELIPHVT